jgi:hypothetical protein
MAVATACRPFTAEATGFRRRPVRVLCWWWTKWHWGAFVFGYLFRVLRVTAVPPEPHIYPLI